MVVRVYIIHICICVIEYWYRINNTIKNFIKTVFNKQFYKATIILITTRKIMIKNNQHIYIFNMCICVRV